MNGQAIFHFGCVDGDITSDILNRCVDGDVASHILNRCVDGDITSVY